MWGYDLDTTSFFGPFATMGNLHFISDRGPNPSDAYEHNREPYTKLGFFNKIGSYENRNWFSFMENGHPADTMTTAEMSKFQFWMAKANGDQTSSTSSPYLRGGRLYKNSDRTIGIDENTFTSYDDDGDCGIGDNNCFANSTTPSPDPDVNLNNGISIPLEISHVGIGANIMPPNAINGAWSNTSGATSGTDEDLFMTDIYEIIYYDRALTDAETSQVEEYLKIKYGTRKSYDDDWCLDGVNCPGDPYGP